MPNVFKEMILNKLDSDVADATHEAIVAGLEEWEIAEYFQSVADGFKE